MDWKLYKLFVCRGWRETWNSIKDLGFARKGIGFLVLLLYENTRPGYWTLPGRDSPKQEQGEIYWSCLEMLNRNRKSLLCINLCINSHLETYTVLLEKSNKKKNVNDELQCFKWSKITFNNFWHIPGPAQLFWTGPGISFLFSTAFAPQAPLPGELLFSWTGPVQISCLSVKSCSLVPFTPYLYDVILVK